MLPGVDINSYAYAGNDPIKMSDPNGHCWTCDTEDNWHFYKMKQAGSLRSKVDAIENRERYDSAFHDWLGYDDAFNRWAEYHESRIGIPASEQVRDRGGIAATETFEAVGVVLGLRTATGSKSQMGSSASTPKSLWTKSNFGGRAAYKRDSLIDPNKVDPKGCTNLQRMRQGRAPIGPDNESIDLHNIGQRDNSPVVELTNTLHNKYRKQYHINPTSTGNGIDRRK